MHRDIKPENLLMVKKDNSPGQITYKLCDFGSAAPYPKSNEMLPNDRTQGTPRYLPPEQYWQMAVSDTWQVGKCLLALRSGAQPHPGTYDEVRASGLYELRDTEWEFLKRCLQYNSGNRQGAGALHDYGARKRLYPTVV
jgi:serine/threonine protein kinase